MALLMPYSSFGKNLICSPQIQHTSFALYPGCLAPTCHSFIVAEQPVSVTNKIIVDKIFFIPYSSIYKPKCQCRKIVGFAGFFVNRWMTKVLEHKHIIIRAEVSEPITKRNKAIKFLNRIIKAIGMKSMYGPTASYCKMAGNRGITAFAIIETSHIAMHIWDEGKPALVQLDVYTCGPFAPERVLDILKELNPTKVEHKYLDREKGFTELTI